MPAKSDSKKMIFELIDKTDYSKIVADYKANTKTDFWDDVAGLATGENIKVYASKKFNSVYFRNKQYYAIYAKKLCDAMNNKPELINKDNDFAYKLCKELAAGFSLLNHLGHPYEVYLSDVPNWVEGSMYYSSIHKDVLKTLDKDLIKYAARDTNKK